MTVCCPTCGTELYVADEGTFKRRCPCCGSLWEFRMETIVTKVQVIATFPWLRAPYVHRHGAAAVHEAWLRYEGQLRGAAREFVDFLRDHRSQDLIDLDVQAEEQAVSSVCATAWEPYTDEDGTFCAVCGAPVEQEDKE